MRENKNHLPVYGVGPFYGVGIILITVIACILSGLGYLDAFKISETKCIFLLLGILLCIIGFVVWFKAAFRIDKYIISNELCTDGIYSWVRNPCYSGIMLMCSGALFIMNNIILLVLPVLYWFAMTILMINTEEKWLTELYGEPYIQYCKQVNRCIPFPSRRKSQRK